MGIVTSKPKPMKIGPTALKVSGIEFIFVKIVID